MGESGAGKSTILNLVIGFNFATDGVVTIDGHDMRDIDLRTYRKHLAVVPQTSILFSGTIRDNITYGIDDFDEEALNKVVDAANLRDLIDSLPGWIRYSCGRAWWKAFRRTEAACIDCKSTYEKS